MARLPIVGGDNSNWGTILNEYLSVEHNSDGSLKLRTDGTLSAADIADAATLTAGVLTSTQIPSTVMQTSQSSIGESSGFWKTAKPWYGDLWSIGNTAGSIGFAGQPTSAPATTVGSGGVTLPLTNGTVPVTDCAQLNANGGSFTLGGHIIVYSGRSASSGAGNATGCYTLSTASGSYASGTALGYQTIGFGSVSLYQKFGDSTGGSNRPIPGTTQTGYVLANYYGPTVDDSAEAFSAFAGLKDTGTAFTQHRPVTGFEAIAQIEGSNTLPDGYTAPLLASGSRTNVVGNSHVKNVIGHKLSHNSTGGPDFGFWDQYDGLYQSETALVTYTTLNGSVALPAATIAVADGTLMPPASPTYPVTVLIAPNSDGVGGQQVTYTGISGNNLTGCTGGTGTMANGSIITNDARSINVKDRVLSRAGFAAGASGWTGTILAATKGGTDAVNSMLAITGPTNAEVSGGLTLMRLNAGSGQTKQILQAYDTSGTNRLSITAAAQMILNGSAINMQQSGVGSARIDSTGYIQPGVSTTAGAGATAGGAKIYSGSGSPSGLVGTLGDIYFRTDTPSTSNQRVYICTVAGAAGAATWTGIL